MDKRVDMPTSPACKAQHQVAPQPRWARAAQPAWWTQVLLLLLGSVAVSLATLMALLVLLCALPLQVLTGGRAVYRLPPRPRWQPATGGRLPAAGPQLTA